LILLATRLDRGRLTGEEPALTQQAAGVAGVSLLRPLFCTALLALAGCESLALCETAKPPASPRASGVDGHLEVMSLLAWPDPGRQSDVFYEVEQAYAQAPTAMNTLRYALALVTPDHPAFNPVQGKETLEQLLANPLHLSASERSLANIMLGTVVAWLKMQNENRMLSATVDKHARAQASAEHRAQAQTEEIAKLRKELDVAQQKLDAIISIERSIVERGSNPSASGKPISDPSVQTQSTIPDR
jgi:hypothetical protein